MSRMCLRTLLRLKFKKKFIHDFSASQINFRIKLNALALNFKKMFSQNYITNLANIHSVYSSIQVLNI